MFVPVTQAAVGVLLVGTSQFAYAVAFSHPAASSQTLLVRGIVFPVASESIVLGVSVCVSSTPTTALVGAATVVIGKVPLPMTMPLKEAWPLPPLLTGVTQPMLAGGRFASTTSSVRSFVLLVTESFEVVTSDLN